MIMKRLPEFLLSLALVLVCCSPKMEIQPEAPVSAFTFTFVPNTNCVQPPVDLIFQNQSKNAAHYFWDFGDGLSSSDSIPLHAYTSVGSYLVKLTAYSKESISTSSTNTVIINAVNNPLGPIVDFVYSKNSSTSFSFTFTAKCKNATSFQWVGGSTDSTFTHTFPGPGIYAITLRASNNECSNFLTKNISVEP